MANTISSATDRSAELQTVLYVEDHPVNVLLMEALFSKRSNTLLHVATTGMQAWRLSATLRPALLLLDLRLPDCHGAPLLKLLRQRPGWQDIRAIAVTAEYEFELEGTGFLEVWSKPLNLPAVMARLDQLLQPGSTPPGTSAEPALVSPSPISMPGRGISGLRGGGTTGFCRAGTWPVIGSAQSSSVRSAPSSAA